MDARERNHAGGIIGLCRLIDEHGKAVAYDLLTRTNYKLDDVFEGGLDWLSLYSFICYLPPDSALVRELCGDTARWLAGDMNAYIMADIYDAIAALIYNHAMAHHDPKKGGRPQKPKPYKRPKQKKKKAQGAQSFGSEGLPVDEFKRWWDTH